MCSAVQPCCALMHMHQPPGMEHSQSRLGILCGNNRKLVTLGMSGQVWHSITRQPTVAFRYWTHPSVSKNLNLTQQQLAWRHQPNRCQQEWG
jgi:hypothetical protein